MSASPTSLEIFCSYAGADEELYQELRKHLSALPDNDISIWSRHSSIVPGSNTSEVVNSHLDAAPLILLLISSDFLASDSCRQEMLRAIQRQKAHTIPILLRPVNWENSPVGSLRPLPKNGTPITVWENHDNAFVDVVQGIRVALTHIHASTHPTPSILLDPPVLTSPVGDMVTQRVSRPNNKWPFFGRLFGGAKQPVIPVVTDAASPVTRKPETQRRSLDPARSRDVENLPTAPVVPKQARPSQPTPLPPQMLRPEIEIEDIEDENTGFLPSSILENIVEVNEDETPKTIIKEKPASAPEADPNSNPDEDPDELPPIPNKLPETPAAIDTMSTARRNAPATPADPAPIVLGSVPSIPKGTGKTTKILPPAATTSPAAGSVVPPPAPVTPPPPSAPRRNTDRTGAPTSKPGSTTRKTPTPPPTSTNKTPVAPTRNPGTSRPITPAGDVSAFSAGWPPPRVQQANRRRRPILLVAVIILIVLVLLGSGWAVLTRTSVVAGINGVLNPAVPPAATITITPASKTIQDNYVTLSTDGKTNPDTRQVNVHQLSSTQTDKKQVPLVQSPAKSATGNITFFNSSPNQLMVTKATTTFAVGNIQIALDRDTVIPGANPPQFGQVTVSAHAVQRGTAGNIAAGAINQNPCCGSPNISVQNQAAFTGGINASNILKPEDLTQVTNNDQNPLTTSAQSDIQKQLKDGEKPLGDTNCDNPKTNSDVPSNVPQGTNVTTANVTVSVTCNAQVYDAASVQTIAQNALKQKVSNDPALKGYVPIGNIAVQSQPPQPQQDGTITFSVTAKGIWYYNWNDPNNKQALLNRIKGKSIKDAQTALNSNPGIDNKTEHPQIAIGMGRTTLPSDVNQIVLDVQKVNGL